MNMIDTLNLCKEYTKIKHLRRWAGEARLTQKDLRIKIFGKFLFLIILQRLNPKSIFLDSRDL